MADTDFLLNGLILIFTGVVLIVVYIVLPSPAPFQPSVDDPFHEVITRCELCLDQFPEVQCDYFNESNTCMALKEHCEYNCTGDFLNYQDARRWAEEDCMAYNANHTDSSCWV